MYSSLRGSLGACTFRGLIAALPIAMICAYSPPSVVPTPPRLVAAQVQNVQRHLQLEQFGHGDPGG
jgi:polysaccharide biosynthesis protein PslG